MLSSGLNRKGYCVLRSQFFAAAILMILLVFFDLSLLVKVPSKPSAAAGEEGAGAGSSAKCTFCSGSTNFNQDRVILQGGGKNTCGSMKTMAAGQLNGSDICALIQEKEKACCPEEAVAAVSSNATKHQQLAVNRERSDGDAHPPILYGHVHFE